LNNRTEREDSTYLKDRNYGSTTVEINKNQCTTKTMQTAIIAEGLDAVRFLPADDKVNLMLKFVSMPVIDDAASMAGVLENAQNTIDELSNTVTVLKAELDKRPAG
jgi:hypothetical protein